jgi:hypothetical protein
MDIYVYSDESGVFDKVHNDYFVFGGLVFLSKEERDNCARKYLAAENVTRKTCSIKREQEIKASIIPNSAKSHLFRSVNQVEKFGIVVKQKALKDEAFSSKKIKQRYLDWAYKVAVRNKLEYLIKQNRIIPDEVKHLYFYVDEHTTATDGVYELQESLEQEFKTGSFDYKANNFHAPLFKNLERVHLEYRDSKTNTLVRAADIVANKLYHMAVRNNYQGISGRRFDIVSHPPLRQLPKL